MTSVSRRAVLAAGFAALGLAACGNPPRAYPADSRPLDDDETSENTEFSSLVMVGDSITEGSANELAAAFETMGIADVQIDGDAGRRIEVGNGKGQAPLSGVRTIFTMLAEGADPDVWVIELGTNDVGSYPDAEAYAELVDLVLGMFAEGTPVLWVNTYREQYPDHTDMFNLVLAQRLAERDNAIVVDWHGAVTAPDADLLSSDNLHPNSAGQVALAMLVAQALQQF